MPRKNKEEYNDYMRNYMRKKYNKDNDKPVMDDDFDASAKPKLDLQGDATKQLMDIGKDIFKDPDTGKPDKILMYLEKGLKYAPLVMKFIEGFAASAKAANADNPENKEDSNTPKPPEGWLNLLPMDKLKYKYSRPAWYAAGEAYDDFMATGQTNPAVDIHKVDRGYEDPPTSRLPPPQEETEANSLKELSKKYGEPPLIIEDDTHEHMGTETVKEKHDEDDQTGTGKELSKSTKNKKVGIKQKELSRTDQQNQAEQKQKGGEKVNKYNAIVNELQADNAKYVQIFVDFINSKNIKEFKDMINNIDVHVKKIKAFSILIPIHLKEMIRNTPAKELEQIVKTHCPDKYKWLKSAKKVNKLTKLFEELKKVLN